MAAAVPRVVSDNEVLFRPESLGRMAPGKREMAMGLVYAGLAALFIVLFAMSREGSRTQEAALLFSTVFASMFTYSVLPVCFRPEVPLLVPSGVVCSPYSSLIFRRPRLVRLEEVVKMAVIEEAGTTILIMRPRKGRDKWVFFHDPEERVGPMARAMAKEAGVPIEEDVFDYELGAARPT